MDNNELKPILDIFTPEETKDFKKYRGRIVMTVELTFDMRASGPQMAEDILNYHELRIQSTQWSAGDTHPLIEHINESLYMSRTYVAEKGIVLG